MGPEGKTAGYAEWEQRAHEPEVQELIRRAIRRGEIRVVPGPGEGIRIFPGDAVSRIAPGFEDDDESDDTFTWTSDCRSFNGRRGYPTPRADRRSVRTTGRRRRSQNPRFSPWRSTEVPGNTFSAGSTETHEREAALGNEPCTHLTPIVGPAHEMARASGARLAPLAGRRVRRVPVSDQGT
jgi:hypothetical protein